LSGLGWDYLGSAESTTADQERRVGGAVFLVRRRCRLDSGRATVAAARGERREGGGGGEGGEDQKSGARGGEGEVGGVGNMVRCENCHIPCMQISRFWPKIH